MLYLNSGKSTPLGRLSVFIGKVTLSRESKQNDNMIEEERLIHIKMWR